MSLYILGCPHGRPRSGIGLASSRSSRRSSGDCCTRTSSAAATGRLMYMLARTSSTHGQRRGKSFGVIENWLCAKVCVHMVQCSSGFCTPLTRRIGILRPSELRLRTPPPQTASVPPTSIPPRIGLAHTPSRHDTRNHHTTVAAPSDTPAYQNTSMSLSQHANKDLWRCLIRVQTEDMPWNISRRGFLGRLSMILFNAGTLLTPL